MCLHMYGLMLVEEGYLNKCTYGCVWLYVCKGVK